MVASYTIDPQFFNTMRLLHAQTPTRKNSGVVIRDGPDILSHFNLLIDSYSGTRKNQVKKFHPISLKLFNGLFLTSTPAMLPNILLDFQQWDESITLNCIYHGNNQEQAFHIVQLRHFLITKGLIPHSRFILQLHYEPTTDTSLYQDLATTVFLDQEYFGFQGMITSGPNEVNISGNGFVKYSLTFEVGKVMEWP